MSGPGSPGGEGPTQAPPHLPPGWIAQWDAKSKKYYYVQLSTGTSQWDVPTDAAPIGGTPASNLEHPYGVPGAGQPELITHPDGSQTVKHADGRLEPVMPDENGGTRAVGDGPSGERGLGTMAMNALLGGNKQSSSSGGSNNLGGLASQVLSGLTHSNTSGHSSSTGQSGSSGLGGKLVGQLASSFFSSGNKPQQQQQQPQNYHGGQTAPHQSSGGLAGSVMGGVSHMFGGQSHSSSQNYGYSNSGQQGGYSGSAPPASYQPAGMPQYQGAGQQHASQSQPPSYHTPAPNTPSYHTASSNAPSHSTPPYSSSSHQPPNAYGHAPQQHGTPSFPPPPNQYEGTHHGYPGPPQHSAYGQHGQATGNPSAPPQQHQYGQAQGPGPAPGHPFGSPQHHGGGFGHQQPQAFGGQQGGYYPPPPGQQHPQHQPYGQGPPINHSSHPYGSNPQY